MPQDERAHLCADVAAAEAEVERLRTEKKRLDPVRTPHGRETGVVRASTHLSEARRRLADSQRALKVFEKTGQCHGLVADDGDVFGSIVVSVPPGAGTNARQAAIEAALAGQLHALARELGLVLAARPVNYTRERPGRDPEGRVVLIVEGRTEGDRLVPAVSRVAKYRRRETRS